MVKPVEFYTTRQPSLNIFELFVILWDSQNCSDRLHLHEFPRQAPMDDSKPDSIDQLCKITTSLRLHFNKFRRSCMVSKKVQQHFSTNTLTMNSSRRSNLLNNLKHSSRQATASSRLMRVNILLEFGRTTNDSE